MDVRGGHSQGRLERVRQWRVRDARPTALSEPIHALRREVERGAKRACEFISSWEEIIPAELAAKTRVRGARGGVYHIAVQDSPALFEIDRLLREGALTAIRSRLRAAIVRIKLAVEPLIDEESGRQ
jgi:hypothetical protein